ncbi:MAG: tyrosine-type recombinase/integrase [Firmicutes bacterium]|nr:tyrosine-type recombinase/integrase [Bacillota bacterium]
MAGNTVQAYIRDIKHFEAFIGVRGVSRLSEATNSEVVAYLMSLKQAGRTKSTVNRNLASIRTYYAFLYKTGEVTVNPADDIKSPKIEKKEIEYLSLEDMDKLMSLPDNSPKGTRDRAILELLYATGIRASELINMKESDVNLRMGFVKCEGVHTKARIIPMGRLCRKAMEDYILDIRERMLKGRDTEELFVNYMGEPMTRQGLWKVLKEYGEEAGFDVKLTPQIIRNSFAVHMLQNGADVKSLQELMGHEDIAATQAYLAVTKNRIKDVYDKAHPRA